MFYLSWRNKVEKTRGAKRMHFLWQFHPSKSFRHRLLNNVLSARCCFAIRRNGELKLFSLANYPLRLKIEGVITQLISYVREAGFLP